MNNTIKNSSLYLIQIAISGVLMLILMPIISQYLSADELGQFVLAQVYSGVAVGIANLGVLVGYERNFFIFEKSSVKSAQLISTAIIFVSFNLLILILIFYLYQSDISQIIFSKNYPINILLTVLIGTVASSLSQYYLTYLKNSGVVKSYIKYAIVNSVINFFIAVMLLVQTNLGPMSLAYAWSISNSILFMLLFVTCSKQLPIGFSVMMLKEMLKISIPLTPRVLFGYLNTQFDKILLGLIGSLGSVGIYHIGQTFALLIFQFMTGLGRVFQPELYRKLFADMHLNSPEEINNYMLPFFYFSILMALLIAIFSNEFVFVLISNEFYDSIIIIIILSVYYSSMFFGKITGAQLIYAKKTYLTTLLMLAGIVINISLNVPFIINWGIVGAAWATTITGILMTTIGYYVAQKYTRIYWKWKSYFILYGVFLSGVLLALVDYNNSIGMNFMAVMLAKFLLLSLYIFLGFKLTIINRYMIKSTLLGLLMRKYF
jgi:O-antigen/teichoic acid export membrane protein